MVFESTVEGIGEVDQIEGGTAWMSFKSTMFAIGVAASEGYLAVEVGTDLNDFVSRFAEDLRIGELKLAHHGLYLGIVDEGLFHFL